MAAWQWNSTVLPAPARLRRLRARVSATRRSLDGTLRVDYYDSGALTGVELEWEALTLAEWTTIRTAYDSGQLGTLEDNTGATYALYWPALDREQANLHIAGLTVAFEAASAA